MTLNSVLQESPALYRPGFEFSFQMIRDPTSILIISFFPCFTLNALTVALFYLPSSDLVDRLSFVGMLLVTYAYILTGIRTKQPDISKMSISDKIITIYFLVTLFPLYSVFQRPSYSPIINSKNLIDLSKYVNDTDANYTEENPGLINDMLDKHLDYNELHYSDPEGRFL